MLCIENIDYRTTTGVRSLFKVNYVSAGFPIANGDSPLDIYIHYKKTLHHDSHSVLGLLVALRLLNYWYYQSSNNVNTSLSCNHGVCYWFVVK